MKYEEAKIIAEAWFDSELAAAIALDPVTVIWDRFGVVVDPSFVIPDQALMYQLLDAGSDVFLFFEPILAGGWCMTTL